MRSSAFILLIIMATVYCTTVSEMMGVNIHWTTPEPDEAEILVKGGWKWIRMDFQWQNVERVKGQYDWSAYDALMGTLNRFSLRAIMILDYGNTLYDDGKPPESDTAVSAFVNFALNGIARYQNKGIFWECWNEPDGKGFWPPEPNPKAYAHLCTALGVQMNATFPNEVLLGPAISSMTSKGRDFAKVALENGFLKYIDFVSTHGYSNDWPEQWLEKHHEMDKLVDHKTILNSEWGYTTLKLEKTIEESEEKQGQYLARCYLTTMQKGVPVHIWYDWRDDCLNTTWGECHFGTVHHDMSPKPAYIAAQTLSSVLGSYTYSHKLLPELLQPLDYVIALTNGPSTAYAAWTLSTIEKTAKFKVDNGTCFNVVDWIGEAKPQICASGDEIKVHVGEGPLYLIPA